MQINKLKTDEYDSIICTRININQVRIKLRDQVNPNEILKHLHSFFDAIIDEGIQHIIFDMSTIPFPSGSLIALLIAKTMEVRHHGGDLQIINLLDMARNNLSFFTPLTFLSIISDADHDMRHPENSTNSMSLQSNDQTDHRPQCIRVNATVDAMQDITDFVAVWAHDSKVDAVSINKLKIAVHEACMNVIEHGYLFEPGKELEIEIQEDEKSFQVMISDWGLPFEKFGKRDYNVQEAFEKQQRGGYGFYIMQQSVDEIRYEFGDDGNRLTLVLEYPESDKEL